MILKEPRYSFVMPHNINMYIIPYFVLYLKQKQKGNKSIKK